MSVIRVLCLSLVVALAMACSSDRVSAPFRGFDHAAAVFDCGPADGAAVAIYLAPNPVGSVEPDAPFVRVFVPARVTRLTDHAWPISKNSEAAAWFHPDSSTWELAEKGYMIVSSVDSDTTVTGSVDLDFPDSGHIKSAFRATWIPRFIFCG